MIKEMTIRTNSEGFPKVKKIAEKYTKGSGGCRVVGMLLYFREDEDFEISFDYRKQDRIAIATEISRLNMDGIPARIVA